MDRSLSLWSGAKTGGAMGVIIETILNLFLIRKMDHIHERSPRAFWVIFWTMAAVIVAIMWWGFVES